MYVAQESIGYRTGGLLRGFLSLENSMEKLKHNRVLWEKYKTGLYTKPKDLRQQAIATQILAELRALFKPKRKS